MTVKKLGLLVLGLGLNIALAASSSNTYTYLMLGGADTLDPTEGYDATSALLTQNIYETLITYKGHSVKDFEPLLATSLPTISPSRLTYTVNLRKGVKFHSGNTMTCNDVKYTFLRALVAGSANSWHWFLRDSLLGTTDVPKANKTSWNKISNSVICKSDYQVVFNLAKVDPAFLAKLAFTNAGVIDSKWAIGLGEWSGTDKDWTKWLEKDLHGSGLEKKPSGTGAYQLIQQSPDQWIFKAFKDYWGLKPKIDTVIAKVVAEQATRISAIQKGEADQIELAPRASLEQVRGSPGVTILDGLPSVNTFVLMMNQKITKAGNNLGSGKLDGKGIPTDFFKDINIRKAFNYSFDQKTYLQQASQGKGKIATMALPDNILGYDPKIPVYNHDPQKAAEYFKKAWGGQVWDKGFVLNIEYGSGGNSTQILAEILKKNIEDLNPKFKINIIAKAWSEVLAASGRGETAVFAAGWAPDYADPDNYLSPFYHTNGAYYTRVHYDNAKMDALLDQAVKTTNLAQRIDLYRKIGQLAYDDAVVILTPLADQYVVLRNEVKGFKENYNMMYNDPHILWKYLSK